MHQTAVDLSDRFEKDFTAGCQYLLDEKFFEFDAALDFLEETPGTDAIQPRIKEMIEALNDAQRQQIEDYHHGAKNKNWMLNRCNMHYIAEHGYI